MQATDEATILVTFENIVATSNDISDVSMKPYQRDIFIESYTVTFASVFDETEDDAFDEVFPLDTRHETIDILDPLVHAIGLEEPFVKYAP
ncbi:hypothetical protein GW750_01925 [bacterium]|nr:hypothetical protein [bacterium]